MGPGRCSFCSCLGCWSFLPWAAQRGIGKPTSSFNISCWWIWYSFRRSTTVGCLLSLLSHRSPLEPLQFPRAAASLLVPLVGASWGVLLCSTLVGSPLPYSPINRDPCRLVVSSSPGCWWDSRFCGEFHSGVRVLPFSWYFFLSSFICHGGLSIGGISRMQFEHLSIWGIVSFLMTWRPGSLNYSRSVPMLQCPDGFII